MFEIIGCEHLILVLYGNYNETKNKILKNSSKYDLLVSSGISNSDTDMIGRILHHMEKLIFGN